MVMKKNIDAMNHPTKVKESIGERIYTIVVYLLLILISATIILPLLHIISGSFSDPMQLLTGKVSFWPKGFTTSMYEKVLKDASIWTGYLNTILYTALGTLISVTLTACAAYPLSRKDLFGRNVFISLFIFTMFFNGGMIPTYLIIQKLGMLNKIWALVLPSAISTYNMILMRNFFESVPESLYEAASIDGETLPGYVFHILLPLSGAAIATITLFYAVGYWNDYFSSIIYIRNNRLWPMQTVLRQVLQTAQMNNMMYDDAKKGVAPETLKDAMIVVTALPIICVYPFLQRYFVKGVMVGSLKG